MWKVVYSHCMAGSTSGALSEMVCKWTWPWVSTGQARPLSIQLQCTQQDVLREQNNPNLFGAVEFHT